MRKPLWIDQRDALALHARLLADRRHSAPVVGKCVDMPLSRRLRGYAGTHATQRHMQIVVVEVHKQLLQRAVLNPVLAQHRQ